MRTKPRRVLITDAVKEGGSVLRTTEETLEKVQRGRQPVVVTDSYSHCSQVVLASSQLEAFLWQTSARQEASMYLGPALRLLLLLLLCVNPLRGQEVDDVEFYFHKVNACPQKLLLNRLPCSCESYTCGCCAGMNIQSYNFSQNACLNLTYDPYEFSITSNMLMNDNSMFTYTFTAKNPPAVCTPVPLPLLPTLVHMCARVFNIFTPGSNLHMCVDFEARIASKPVVILHFDCLRVGANGFALLKPEDEGGLKPPAPVDLPGDDEYDEVTEE